MCGIYRCMHYAFVCIALYCLQYCTCHNCVYVLLNFSDTLSAKSEKVYMSIPPFGVVMHIGPLMQMKGQINLMNSHIGVMYK